MEILYKTQVSNNRLPFLLQHRVAYRALLCGEVYTYFIYMPAVGGKGRAVVLFFYLAQGGIGCLVNLQLEYIDIVACLHHYVHAAIGSMPLNVYIQAHQLEQHIYHVLEIYLLVAHYLIVATGKQTLQAVHEAFRIACAHFLYEVANLEWSLLRGLGGIEGNEIPDDDQ